MTSRQEESQLDPLEKTCIWGKHSFGIIRPSTYQIWMMPSANYSRFFKIQDGGSGHFENLAYWYRIVPASFGSTNGIIITPIPNIWLHKYSVWVFPMIFVTKTALSLASSRYEKYRILGFQNCAYLKCMFFTGVKVKIVTFLQDYSLVKSKHGWSQSVRRTPNAALCQPCTERSCKGESG